MAQIIMPKPVIPLDASFIEKYMPSANHTHVAVYIYALGMCYLGKPSDNESIAGALDILESDVVKAWKYWMKKGLIRLENDGTVCFLPVEGTILKSETKNASPENASSESAPSKRNISINEVTKKLESDKAFSQTLELAQHMWGRPLTQSEIKAIFSFSEWYSFSNEVLLILIEYCAANEKTKNIKYLESVAEGWHNDGINTVREAEKVLKRKEKEHTMIAKCAKIFGIGRAFSDKEEQYISKWTNDLSMSEAMIKEAYARTTINTGKLSFQYMDKIMCSWHKEGIKTLTALKEAEGTSNKRSSTKKPVSATYDFDEIERRDFERRLKKSGGSE